MNKKIFGLVAGGIALLVISGHAYALSVNAAATGAAQGVAGMTGMQATTSAQSQGALGVAGVNVGLTATVQAGDIDTSSASGSAIVNLEDNTEMLIQASSDLATYDSLVVKARPSITSINVGSNGGVVINYSQPAKFLGIFSASLPGQVNVDTEGNATVSMPWWSVLYSKDTAGVQSSVAASVAQAQVSFDTQADAGAGLQNSARLVNAVTAAIQAQTEASASATASASGSGY